MHGKKYGIVRGQPRLKQIKTVTGYFITETFCHGDIMQYTPVKHSSHCAAVPLLE